MNDTPILSVIVPYNGSKMLRHFLQSLLQQTLSPDRFEVIIVQDGETDAEKVTSLFNSRSPLKLCTYERALDFGGHSAGPCRNMGAKQALGEYFVFVDSDCILHPECLKIHLYNLEAGNNFAVCGGAWELPASEWDLVLPPCFESFAAIEAASKPDARIDEIGLKGEAEWHCWYSCNASVSRKTFFAAGGFDETGYRCHDMELAYRLRGSGAEFLFDESARVVHVEHPRSIISRTEQQKGWRLIARKYPELESFIFDRMLESQRHQIEIALYCEEQFLALTNDQPGIRSGYRWIFPPGTDIQNVLLRLVNTPFAAETKAEYVSIKLGFHRNCWDYELFIPFVNTETTPSITILIPFFNPGEKILDAISSVLVQTRQNFEIVLIDDASNDDSQILLRPFLIDPRVRFYVNAENAGLSHSLNVGLDHASAPIIVHLDSDDWLEVDALEKVLSAFEKNPGVGAVYGDAFLHTHGRIIEETGSQVTSFEDFFSYSSIQAPRAYRRESLFAIGGWTTSDGHSGRYYEDRVTLAAIFRKQPVLWLGDRLYHCRLDSNSLSRTAPETTASAKLSFLHDIANKNNFDLQYTYGNYFLKAEFVPRSIKRSTYSWSVIIPFAEFEDLLYFSVLSWLESDFSENIGEIIIVDDASGEDVNKIAALAPDRIRIIRNPERIGAGASRNKGVSAARFEMLFFSDADHIIPPDIIGRHSKKLEQGHSVVVGNIFGRRTLTVIHSGIQKRHKEKILRALQFSDLFETVAAVLACDEHLQLIPNTAPSTVWERVQKFSFTDYWLARWGEIILNFGENLENFNFQWTRISTGSMSLQKKDFLELGGFDTQLQSMEDWELGIRIQQSGMSIVCAPEAEPFHQVHPPNKNRPSDNEKAVTYLTSKHLGIIEALLSEPPYSAPPIQFFFSKSAISEYKDRSLDIMPGTDHPDGNFCLLTFDDGPHPIGTPMVLETLARYDATALFFLIGQQVSSYPSLVKMLVDNGHEIGVHNWSHTDCSMLTSYEVKQKLADTMDRIFDLTGCRVKYARPPYGKFSPSYQEACFELKLTPVGWTSSSEDWAANSARDIIISLARRGIKDKVILFHDVGNNLEETIEGLDWLLRTCKERDIKIATPEEFMKRHCLPSMEICNPFI